MLDLLEVELRVRSLPIDRQNQYIWVVSDNTTTVSEITKVFTNASPMEARPSRFLCGFFYSELG